MENSFKMGNFSCSLRVELPQKEAFIELYAGKLTTDAGRLYEAYAKAHAKVNKPVKVKAKKQPPAEAED